MHTTLEKINSVKYQNTNPKTYYKQNKTDAQRQTLQGSVYI